VAADEVDQAWLWLEVKVRRKRGAPPLTGSVRFYVNDDFEDQEAEVAGGKAETLFHRPSAAAG
jgi:hypothetical protein